MNVREFILEATAHPIIMFRLVHMSLSTLVFLNVACTVAKQSEGEAACNYPMNVIFTARFQIQ
jgi:hypothetical protein